MQAAEPQNPLTVTEITARIKSLIDDAFGTVWVTGEISNWRRQASGHCYFTLKDADAQLRCVMWRGSAARLSAAPQDGMQVLARGDLTVYERYGQHQMVVTHVQPAGIGALQAAFEQLKAKLVTEGVFEQARKRTIPAWPATVGIVTSGTGAAVRDIITVIGRRMPTTRIIVRPTVVQGDAAAPDIVRAIAEFGEHGEADVLIVGRGGGSLEDLWAFNEETVVRAIAGSAIPIVSAVGHEIDITLSDFAADVRAPTPSAAAELVVPDSAEVRQGVAAMHRNLVTRARNRIDGGKERLAREWTPEVARRMTDRIGLYSQEIDRLTEGAGRRTERIAAGRAAIVSRLAARLDAVSPLKVLSRGYSVCEREPDGALVTDASQVQPNDRFRLRLQRGIILGIVESRIG